MTADRHKSSKLGEVRQCLHSCILIRWVPIRQSTGTGRRRYWQLNYAARVLESDMCWAILLTWVDGV